MCSVCIIKTKRTKNMKKYHKISAYNGTLLGRCDVYHMYVVYDGMTCVRQHLLCLHHKSHLDIWFAQNMTLLMDLNGRKFTWNVKMKFVWHVFDDRDQNKALTGKQAASHGQMIECVGELLFRCTPPVWASYIYITWFLRSFFRNAGAAYLIVTLAGRCCER